jgi:signal transduction histidine kinase
VTENGVVRSGVVAGAAAMLTLTALLAGGAAAFQRTAEVCLLASAVAVLCAGVFFYIHWHIGGEPSMAWLVTVAGAYSVQKLGWSTVVVGDAGGADDSGWAYLFQIGAVVALGTLLVRGDRLPVRRDPLALGLAIGLALVVGQIGVLELPAPALSSAGHLVLVAGLSSVGLVNAVRLLRSSALSADLRHRVALASVFLAVGQIPAPTGSLLAVSAVASVVGSAVLLATAVSRSRSAITDETTALHVLRSRLETAGHELRHDQARLHEIRATLAGIAHAAELQQRDEIGPQRRAQLHQMTVAELHRLERLVSGPSTRTPEPTELDATLRPIVLRHEAAGLPVQWQPSGHVAIVRPDDVAEIVNVLLSNAARHALGGPVQVEVQTVGDQVAIAVSDTGPGIDPEVRPALFTWGAHTSRSPGEGIGLAAARLLAEDLGGRLDLVPASPHPPGGGARFVLSLPAPVPAQPQDVTW